MKKIIIVAFSTAALLVCQASSMAQQVKHIAMTEANWQVQAKTYRFEQYLGQPSLYLPSGIAELNHEVFHNGILEFDIAFSQMRGFPGITFRRQDAQNYEEFYVRPHQSGHPDANQYTPVFNDMAGWQLYYGKGHGAPVTYHFDDWNHVRIIVNNRQGAVYINNMDQPLLLIPDLKWGDISGTVALKGSAEAHFANFSYQVTDHPPMPEIAALPPLPDNVIQDYKVSSALADQLFAHQNTLPAALLDSLTWHDLSAEPTGTLNIARVTARGSSANTALVRTVLRADSSQLAELNFGFSDRVSIYLNGSIIYSGDNTYRSRDYRFLGTIGYFDSVFLPLQIGDNVLIFAVTEKFGGWGIKARIADTSGIHINK